MKRLTDAELISQVKTLVGREREATALLVAHLSTRRAMRIPREALNRIEAARAARRRCGRHNRYEAKVYFRRNAAYGEGAAGEVGTGNGAEAANSF